MKHLEIEPSVIHLQGISRASSFKLVNKNDFLAVSFSIVAVDKSVNALKVFPDQGILLGGQQQKIRVKLSSEQNSTSDEVEVSYYLLIRYTYNSQYNKRCLIKNNMKSWNQLEKAVFQKQVRIVSGGQRQDIENYIKQQINFEKKFGTEQMDISAIVKQQNKEVENQSYIDLDISSKFEDQKQNKIEQKLTKTNLNASIDVDRIIPLDIGQSRSKNQVFSKKINSNLCEKDQIVQSKLLPQNLNKSFEITMKTAQKNSFSKDGTLLNSSTQLNHKQRTLDIVILAVISAFFVALGSNIKKIMS